MSIRSLILGFLLGLIALPLAAYLYIRFGYAPVATAAPPLPMEKQLAHMALKQRIEKEAPKDAPIQATETNLAAGAHIYRDHCAVCHGLSGQPKTATAKGMFPQPPQLFEGHGVTDDSPGETYWKTANGIRLSGMPAYTGSLSNDQMWQVSLMLANADKLPPSVQTIVKEPLPAH